jgi:ABC-type amino acid transport substrate-binding protein
MRKIVLCLATLTSLSLPLEASAVDTLAKIRETKTIRFAYIPESEPFSYVDEKQQVSGYAIDLCLKIADAVKRELKLPNLNVQFLPVDTASRFTSLIEGKADVECGSTTNNAERRKKFDFTIPHFYSGVRMLVRTGTGIKNWPDLKDKTVVTTKSTTSIKLLNDRSNVRGLNAKLLEGNSDADSFAMVEQGRADAFPMDDVLLYSLRSAAKNPSALSIVGDALSIEPYALMLRKEDTDFKRIVDREMLRVIAEGEIYRLYERWFMHPVGLKGANMNMPMGYLLRESLRFPTDKVVN